MRTFWLIAPYAAWMALMMALPATAECYAVRTCVTVALLVPTLRARLSGGCRGLARRLAWGVPVGLAVFAVWILPEQFDWPLYRRFCIVGEGGVQGMAGAGVALLAVRLFGSAFVISAAEELFFRKWLVGFAGFWWMVALFAVEHDRWLVGAVAGAVYGWMFLRRGLGAAIVAHATTNLALGLWVLRTGQWQFW
ncbi:MAG: CAAX prenyl protease-related protein [Kiritimatiellae bacterium]|nr:CAAX prenyl protease-related protein [Kiritimatiellia bacterium]MBQ3343551.1 CAAX prenyl protease-related protein [Kiritimatiellia bacterium]